MSCHLTAFQREEEEEEERVGEEDVQYLNNIHHIPVVDKCIILGGIVNLCTVKKRKQWTKKVEERYIFPPGNPHKQLTFYFKYLRLPQATLIKIWTESMTVACSN